ncbi:MAG: universal stress protein [Bacteriovoracaceae bacterium]|nr:universal stress protein [Bacteriovoracaceae bacterium]
MKFAKKVVIAVPLTDNMSQMLEGVRGMEFLKESEVHLISVFNTINYAVGLGEVPLVYPIIEDRKKIEESIMERLKQLSTDILPAQAKERAVIQCLFGENAKETFCDYVEKVKADTVVVATRKKRDFFESSFAHYVTKHLDADVIILKNHL